MISSKVKVYELAKELGVESQILVGVVQRLGIDIKNTMSVLGSEEVRTVREHYRKNRPMPKAPAAGAPKSPMTEKRVGATLIRRRAVDKKEEAPKEEPIETKAPEPESETVSEVDETPTIEQQSEVVEAGAEEAEAPVVEQEAEEAPEAPQVESKETTPPVAPSEPPKVAPVPPKPAPKRFYPSIIKKVATEQHLVEAVGPKVERKERPPKEATTAAKPGTAGAKPATSPTTAVGLKRVKEIELTAPLTEAQKEAGKRRIAQRQDTVFRSTDYLKRELIHATKKKKNAINRPAMKTQITQMSQRKRVVTMGETIKVADLAHEMGVKATAVIQKLMGMGVIATMNQAVDFDSASLVAQEFQFEVKQQVFKEEEYVPQVALDAENLQPRAPVVTIMGHVDHGKTSLLDAIRKTSVAAGEAGGITQHIGAYTVNVAGKGKVSFLDTPGHEAFTAMRARGAKVTDIVILVVSAIDGVMPQTLESISHAKAANVPIIVAVNKIDLPDANPDRIKQTLAGHGLNPEEWGGDTIYVNVSAKTGQNLDKLLESILLQAEILELKANYDVRARGSVVESRLDKNRGPVATILVQHGRLKPGDIVVCGVTSGRVRAMYNSAGQKVEEAQPSDPVEILGLDGVPSVGDEFNAVEDDKAARELTAQRSDKAKEKAAADANRPSKMTLEQLLAAGTGGDKELRLILKADVQGSAEALREAFTKLPSDKVKLKCLLVSAGGVTESDVMLATASQAVILGFNVRPDIKAQKLAEAQQVELRTYTIIYDLLDDVKRLMEGLLDSTVKEKVIGRAEVREIFNVPKIGQIAGSAVIDGKVIRGCFLRLLRDSRVIYEGKISSLRRFKEDVKEVAQGFECGIGLENFNDLKLGDQFEAFLKEEVKGQL